jgi:hypothetical protein
LIVEAVETRKEYIGL